ncbi:efflux RND transporter permease subunit [Arthrobacter sp. BB-1]|uniref:efflux RND transporter permease subunit n=1 Tax=unclassified Arthrobacter TaxID=235627 RepID=UPI0010DEF2AA|nr:MULTISPECIES: efflux RND transporter permease subunit [unclassified Arthrobacter]TNB75711.1 efflux RND transporter permease subunit [Arthrobacter sp. BB-1]VII98918.1 CzcABC family efflux RND transporter, transmembrane protein [Arthrobacter sp. DR-2P]
MRRLITYSLRFRSIVVALAVGIMMVGAVQISSASVDVFPEFAPPRVEVQTAALGLTAAEVEELVTVPLEEALNGVEGLDELRSKSVSQLSAVLMIFEPGTDLLKARQLVSERVATVTPTLPSWATPPVMLQPLSSTSRVMKIGLSSDTRSLIEMTMLTHYKLRAHLLSVPGVANVAIWGARKETLQVRVEPEKMKAHNVTMEQVMSVANDALAAGLLKHSSGNLVGTGGFVETPNQRLGVGLVLPIRTAEDLAKVIIDNRNGTPLRLGDVAQVVVDHNPLIGDAVINDGEGLMLIVEKLPWGNTLEVTRGVEEALKQMAPALDGVEVDTAIFRPATFIEQSLENLSLAMLLGIVLVMMVLGAFLFQWRTALISLIAIPLSLITAGVVIMMTGSTVNTMVLAGLVIAVGVVVDDAIIDIENIIRRLRQHRSSGSARSTASVVLEASVEVRGPIVYATLIIVVAAVPIFFLEGLTGAFFRPLATSYTLAVFASMLVALTVTPALALIFLRKAPLDPRDPPLVRVLKRGYHSFMSRVVRRPAPGYVAFAGLTLVGALVAPLLGQALLPSFKERDFLMHWVTQPGTSLKEEVRISERACRELLEVEGVLNCGSHIGQALAADEVVGVNFGENWISVDPEVDYDKTLATVQEVVDGYPGIFRDVQTYLKERIREVLTGDSGAVVVRVYGDDLQTLREVAKEIEGVMGKIPEAVEEHVSLQVDIPQVDVKVNLDAAQRLGLKPGDVRRQAAAFVASEEVGDLWRDGKVYDVRIWSPPELRSDVTSIENLPINTPTGSSVRLADVADVSVNETPAVIERNNNSRRIDISADAATDGDLGALVEKLEDGLAEVNFPTGYHAEILGEFAEREAATQRLMIFAAGALIAIFLLLQASFGSWRLAALIMFTLPVALVGGVLAAYLSGGVLSLGSIVGFLTVMGIAARNGILLISHCQHLEKYEDEKWGPELVLRGAGERLSPILMTTLATGLALVPLIIMGTIPGHEIEHPMAVVILGGLVTSTLLNLFILPSLYLRFGKSKKAKTVPPAPTVPVPAT